MTVRDYQALQGAAELVAWDEQFDLARAVKSEAELESVRDSVRINADGFWAFLEAYEPGKPAAEALAAAERLFVERGCRRPTMNMVLAGAEFAPPRSRSPARAATGSRSRAQSAGRPPRSGACSRPTRSTSRRRRARSGPAR